jgi:DNA-binding response OmpR family regulator
LVKVIVVDDDVDLREGLVECLRLAGFEAIGVGSALNFYQALSTTCFDVAVLDVNLPDADGYSIARFLSERTNLGIVFMTGRGRKDDRIAGFRCGADLYFVKPVSAQELSLAIANLARRLRAAPPPAEVIGSRDENAGSPVVFGAMGSSC